jgi:iron complex outermembrane recepter protein
MRYFLTSISIIFHISLFAQFQLEGHILSKKDSTYIRNAIIQINGKNHLIKSDNQGNFIIENITSSNFKLKISHISFNDTSLNISLPQKEPIIIYLSDKTTEIPEITITATRTEKKTDDVLARIDIISSKELDDYSNTNFDNALQSIANVYVNRSWGIFSKNSSLTMRGMDGASRVLVLLDGVPLNLSAGGGINWHLIESGQVERVEVLKGPASALYGNNAMGGVINIITKKRSKTFLTEASIFGGTYNTFGGKINIGGNQNINQKGLYWKTNAFYRQGDGYIIVPENERDSNDVKIGLKEYSLNFSSGYQFNQNQKIDFSFRLYDDKRDEGIKIFEQDGSYLKYTTQFYQGAYTGKVGKLNIYLKSFYQRQDYYQHSERLNETGDSYKLYDRNQVSKDYGVWLNMVRKYSDINELSFGTDFKNGSMFAEDIYFTSTDYFKRGGNIDYYAIFAQDELKLRNNKLILNIGLRADIAQFNNGFLDVTDPTSVTAFDSQLSENFQQTSWKNISPKIALQYKFGPQIRLYISYSMGFMPPTLDDMVSSRKINKGFKIANPNLKPETLTNYEIGFDYIAIEKFKIQFSGYYAVGSDFQYFAHTGDTVDIDKPILMRQNVSSARIYGIETSLKWEFFKYFSLKANYTYNNSMITKYSSNSDFIGDDLTGKYLSETPPHQVFIGCDFNSKLINISLASNYISAMWTDEYNVAKLDAYSTFDIRISKIINPFKLTLDIQNIFDNQYIDKKNGLSPGRFIMMEISYRYSK